MSRIFKTNDAKKYFKFKEMDDKDLKGNSNGPRDQIYENGQIMPHCINDEGVEEKNLISNIFSTRKPKHAGAGLVSGLKSVTKGIIVGTSFLFISPYLCAKAEGINGFFKGVFFGILSAIVIPVISVGVASYQIGRGIINTPESITQRALGKMWDDEKREWYDFYYNLDDEANKLLNDSDDDDKNNANSDKKRKDINNDEYYNKNGNIKVKNDEYYQILKVPIDASQNEIKRQYYKLAKEFHPDKCSDLKAKEHFQKIGEAYQVLGDVERRRRYDKEGKNAINNMQFIDSTFFFTLLFGSEKLDPYIGKLRMVMYVEYEQLYKDEDVQRIILKAQNKREVKLALHLRDMITNYINESNSEEYIIKFKKEINELCQTSFGHVILENVAWSYENCANQFLGDKYSLFGISGKYYKMQQKKRVIGTGLKFVRTLIKTSSLASQIQKDDDGEISIEKSIKANKKLEDSLPTVVETMLNICLIDIDQTIKGVCKKVFTDMSVDESVRKARAESLIVLAKVMKKVIQEYAKNNEITDTKKLFEDACMRACQKPDDEYI